jgi:integrase
MGSIYKRSNVLWIKYSKNGKPYFESTKSDKMMVATKLLKLREGEIAQGKIPGVCFERVKFSELAEDFLTDYRINGRKSLERAERSVELLKGFFGNCKATDINTSEIKRYIENRMNDGAASGTINRELSALKRMLNLGARCTPPKVDRVPFIPMLKENNVRKGFFEHEQFMALREELPDFLRPVVTFAYKTGWRKSEVINLEWSQVDLKGGTVRLNPGETKNDRGRMIYLDEELKQVLQNQASRRKRFGKICPYVFLNELGTDRLKDFRGSWDSACERAGVGGKLFHDFRRSGVRNMVRAGVPERVAMQISGHLTRSVFERYNIVSDEDLKMAATRQELYLSGRN